MYSKLVSKVMNLRVAIGAMLCFFMLVILYSIYWYTFAGKLKESITLFILDQGRKGFHADFEQMKVTGYPGTLRIIISTPSLAARPALQVHQVGIWRWNGPRLIAEVNPWNFNKIRVHLSGDHQILIDTLKQNHEYNGSAKDLSVELELFEDGFPVITKLQGSRLKIIDTHTKNNFSIEKISLTMDRLFPEKPSIKEPNLDMQLGLQKINFKLTETLPLGNFIKSLSFGIQLIGKIDRRYDMETLEKWRDGGGIIELTSIEGAYGPLKFNANGTLTLDDKLQLLASFSTKIIGVSVAIDQLSEAQIIQPSDAAMAKIFLSIYSKKISDNGSSAVLVPMNIQNGQLSIHDLKLLNVPKIEWFKTARMKDNILNIE